MVEAVNRQTEGNPLFVTEVVRLLVQEGELVQGSGGRESWSVRIPEGVREVIGRRLDRLSERCNETLTVASVIGREFTLGQLKPLSEDISEDRLLEVLEEAMSARVIDEMPRTVGRYQFTHALIQETLAGELSTTRRVRLHACIAESMENLYGEEAEGHAAELAHHFSEAQTVLGVGKLVKYSHLAGNRALAAYAYEEALAHYQHALLAKEGQELGAETASSLFGLGRAQLATLERPRWLEAMGNLDRAFDYYAGSGDVGRAVAVAEYPVPTIVGRNSGTSQRIARALTTVPPDSLAAGRLLALHGRILGQEIGDYEAASDAFGRALAIAQREDDAPLEFRTLAGASYMDGFYLRWRECLEKTTRAIELAKRVDDPHWELLIHWSASGAELATGHLDAGREHTAEGMLLAERLRDRFWLCGTLWRSGNVSQVGGDWQSARDATDRGLAFLPMDVRLLTTRALLEYQVGDLEQGEAYLERFPEAMRAVAPGPSAEYGFAASLLPLTQRIAGAAYRSEIAESAAQAVLSSAFATPLIANLARTGLALVAVERGDAVVAAEQYSVLKPSQGTIVSSMLTSGDRLLGLLARTMGNLNQAGAHLEDALAFCRKAGYRPELAWTCCDYADALLQRNVESDRSKAMSLLDESLSISSELGMRPLMERVLSRRELL